MTNLDLMDLNLINFKLANLSFKILNCKHHNFKSLGFKSLGFKSFDFESFNLKGLTPKKFFLSVLSAFFFNSSLQATFYDRKAEGWHWYEDLLRRSIVKEDNLKRNDLRPGSLDEKIPRKKEEVQEHLKPQDDPILRMEGFRHDVERLKAIAILNPTFQNVKAYMEIQKELLDRSTRFAQKWIEVVYKTPTLDYTLHHPTTQAARHVYLDQKRTQLEHDIRTLSTQYGLFFFYSSNCAYCKAFAPIVKSFSGKYGWKVLAISLDGTFLPEFPESKADNGSAKALGVQFVPLLIAVEPKSGKVIPLSHGMSTHDQIEDRIRTLILKRNDL